MIRVDGLHFSYGKTLVLKNLNLTFEPGRYHIILGPSGSGKSTLLKLMAGLLEPSSGKITRPSTYGYVLQEDGLFYHLSAFENIAIQGQMLKWSFEKITRRVDVLCELTKYPKNLLAQSPHDLSGGQRQRVSLMRALFLDPEVLLLDESLSGLDPILKYDLMKDLRQIISNLRKTTIHITHDLVEASLLGDQIVLLYQGQAEEASLKEQFFSQPKSEYTKKFIQSQSLAK